ncbi:hypothetical protein KSP39_PZI016530 [Platanthera zijinensis]|uniref:Uncharacterized protein n=1 Tax=Platanthera zijinensis TaxID=2320716 RepID=A0AAP0B6H8_9ASPA
MRGYELGIKKEFVGMAYRALGLGKGSIIMNLRKCAHPIVTVVHICEATLTKRLIEFENTESGSLTNFDSFLKDFKCLKAVVIEMMEGVMMRDESNPRWDHTYQRRLHRPYFSSPPPEALRQILRPLTRRAATHSIMEARPSP